MVDTKKTLTVRLSHNSSIPGTMWCFPVGWKPTNSIPEQGGGPVTFSDGSWWDSQEEVAGLIWFGTGRYDEHIEANMNDLRVASCGRVGIIGSVEI